MPIMDANMTFPSEPSEPARVRDGRQMLDLCNAIGRASLKRVQAKMSAFGLSAAAYNLIRAVGAKEDVTMAEIGKALRVESATLSALAVRMERDGLLQREPSPTDKRSMFLKPTHRARDLCRQADAVMAMEFADITHRFSDAEREQLVALLRRALANIDPEAGGPRGGD